MSNIWIQPLTGAEVQRYINDLARLRIEIFRDFPYLYDGDLDYEMNYLQTYSNSPESLFVMAFAGDIVIGASTGVPMEYEEAVFKQPFFEQGYDPNKIFYFGESVLRKPYRGQGIGVRFFHEREAYAKKLGRFDYTAFCAVERPLNHPRRPIDYVPLDQFWTKRGYQKHPELMTYYRWRDLDEAEESPKLMVFWMKQLMMRKK